MKLLHATCVKFEGRGILLLGKSGAGKSDLALRLIDAGGVLIGDDYVNISAARDGKLKAESVDTIAGMIEVRGVGLVRMTYEKEVLLSIALDLVRESEKIDRLGQTQSYEIEGQALPLVPFKPFEASAIAKLRVLLKEFERSGIL